MREYLYPILISAAIVLIAFFVVLPHHPDLGMAVLFPGVVVSMICMVFDPPKGMCGPVENYLALVLSSSFVFYGCMISFLIRRVRKLRSQHGAETDLEGEPGTTSPEKNVTPAEGSSGRDTD